MENDDWDADSRKKIVESVDAKTQGSAKLRRKRQQGVMPLDRMSPRHWKADEPALQ